MSEVACWICDHEEEAHEDGVCIDCADSPDGGGERAKHDYEPYIQ